MCYIELYLSTKYEVCWWNNILDMANCLVCRHFLEDLTLICLGQGLPNRSHWEPVISCIPKIPREPGPQRPSCSGWVLFGVVLWSKKRLRNFYFDLGSRSRSFGLLVQNVISTIMQSLKKYIFTICFISLLTSIHNINKQNRQLSGLQMSNILPQIQISAVTNGGTTYSNYWQKMIWLKKW